MNRNLKKYSLVDLLSDESFQDWCLGKSENSAKFWSHWVQTNPDQEDIVNEAREILGTFKTNKNKIDSSEVTESWEKLESRILCFHPGKTQHISHFQKLKNFRYLKYAASVAAVLLISIASWVIFFQTDFKIYETAYGEKISIDLPDGSTVWLNGKSLLKVPNEWEGVNGREVWLDGEGFFEVVELREAGLNMGFIVHTDNLDVSVLGTKFNVDNRQKRTRVVLNSGRVRVDIKKPKSVDTLFLKPGEMIEVFQIEATIKKKVKPTIYSSWVQDIIEFENTSLSEIVFRLKENNGIEVILDKELYERKYTGKIPNDVNTLINAIALSFDLEVKRKKKVVILSVKK